MIIKNTLGQMRTMKKSLFYKLAPFTEPVEGVIGVLAIRHQKTTEGANF
jgi:hypothetical protein